MDVRAVFMTLVIFIVIGTIAFLGLLGTAWILTEGQAVDCCRALR